MKTCGFLATLLSFFHSILALVDRLASGSWVQKHLPPASMENVADSLLAACDILPDKLAGWLVKDEIDLLKSFIFGLWHEEDLIKPSNHGDTAIEAKGQSRSRHGLLH